MTKDPLARLRMEAESFAPTRRGYGTKEILTEIADMVESELHKKRESAAFFEAECIRLRNVLDDMERTHMELPVDADGVPIRPGDEVCTDSSTRYVVEAVDYGAVVLDDVFMRPADECRHVKHDTVEDVLCELSDAAMSMHSVGFMPIDEIRKYAERIRKAVEQ